MVFMHHIETLVPPYTYRQDYARDRMQEWLPGRKTGRLIRGIYNRSGIETRCSVLPDFCSGADADLFKEDVHGRLMAPTTEPRNRLYTRWARSLSVEVARNALARSSGFVAEEVTHVITVSCTGFSNPGPDLEIVRDLGLADSVERYHLGFMGCYAAFPAMRMARQFCEARKDAVVMVVCLELCSLHLQIREEPDSLLANALFADGAAAVIISARRPRSSAPALALRAFHSALAPEGSEDMAWSIGDHGFNLRLSTYVPEIIASNLSGIVGGILASGLWGRADIDTWAIHPGGRSILDKVQAELGLTDGQISDSRAVLKSFGNMSSVTILFVLERILARPDLEDGHALCAMAFGPGLTIESGLLERVAGASPATLTFQTRKANALV
jgi:predicted naringenin-chalcone synthase